VLYFLDKAKRFLVGGVGVACPFVTFSVLCMILPFTWSCEIKLFNCYEHILDFLRGDAIFIKIRRNMSIDHLLALSGVMPRGASGRACCLREMARAGSPPGSSIRYRYVVQVNWFLAFR
jgi:hypothetical protein